MQLSAGTRVALTHNQMPLLSRNCKFYISSFRHLMLNLIPLSARTEAQTRKSPVRFQPPAPTWAPHSVWSRRCRKSSRTERQRKRRRRIWSSKTLSLSATTKETPNWRICTFVPTSSASAWLVKLKLNPLPKISRFKCKMILKKLVEGFSLFFYVGDR